MVLVCTHRDARTFRPADQDLLVRLGSLAAMALTGCSTGARQNDAIGPAGRGARYANALSRIPHGVLLLDADDRLAFVNTVYRRLFSAGEDVWAEGRPFVAAYADNLVQRGCSPPDAGAAAEDWLETMRADDSDHEQALANGRVVRVSHRHTDDGGLLCVVSDITDVKANEQLLALRAAAMDSAQDGIAIADGDLTFIYANPAFQRMFGIGANANADDDLRGRSWTSLFTEDNAAWIKKNVFPTLRETGRWRGELPGRRVDGGIVEQEITLTLLEGVGLICVTRDVAERRQGEIERARLIGHLSAAQRQEAIGVIAAGIAHDLNNIVSVVTGSADLIAESPATGPVERRHARRIDQAGRSMADLINRLLDFARRSPARTDVALADLVAEAGELVRLSVESNVTLTLLPCAERVLVRGDTTNLLQVILNLAINARDAIADRAGTITIAARSWDADCGPDPEGGTVLAGDVRQGWTYGVIDVADTGRGIEPDTLRRIVEPYYSTKGDAGTGLGLAVVAGIVQSMRGFLTVHSVPDAGTTFSVHLPTADVDLSDEDAVAQEAALAASIDLSGRLILLVDDDEPELEILQRILERAGAEVAACNHPYDAAHTIQDDPEAWDLLITDFEMPDMSGAGLAAKVHGIAPELPIVLYTARADWRANARPGDHTLFQREIIKPAQPGALVRAVAALLSPRQETEEKGR